jgi:hypothetical protein
MTIDMAVPSEAFHAGRTEVSVILCARNPRADYLARVLQSLKAQKLTLDQWDLLLVDSASENPLESRIDLSWHPRAQHLREERPGLLPARMRGIQEAFGELLVFVDDDTILDPDYLEQSLSIARHFPKLGVWGGSVLAEYEVTPPEWIGEYEHEISVREISRDSWSNLPGMRDPWVIGAGMSVRRNLARRYAKIVEGDSRRHLLGRNPASLLGAEDIDLVLSVCDEGHGRGVFRSLKLIHLIPPHRCKPDYLEAITKGNAASFHLIRYFRGEVGLVRSPGVLQNLWMKIKESRLPHHRRMYHQSARAGIKLAEQIIRDDLTQRKGNGSTLGIPS